MGAVSIVVPTLNETANIAMLAKRISDSFANTGLTYEIIFVDDRSKDGTLTAIKKLESSYPVSFATKIGPRGKAFSLLQGFKMAQYNTICMIDADLQYPPEAIVPMYHLMTDNNVDMILSDREDHETSKLRQLSSKVFNFLFTRLLFGFDYDSQSGLKLFKKKVVKDATLNPTPWSFDLEFIVRALENNFRILTYKIPFSSRYGGETKVRVVKLTYELAKASIKLRLTSSPKKVKKAYQNNLQISKHAASMLVIPIFGLILAMLYAPAPTSALSIVDETVLASVSIPFTPILSPISPNPIIPTQPVPTASQPEKSSSVDPVLLGTNTPVATTENTKAAPPPPSGFERISRSVSAVQPSHAELAPATSIKTSYSSFTPPASTAYTQSQPKRFNGVVLPLTLVMLGSLAVIAGLLATNKSHFIYRFSGSA